jgi:ABC-type lipoprotein export system ATPase subunit/cell division protein FtsX
MPLTFTVAKIHRDRMNRAVIKIIQCTPGMRFVLNKKAPQKQSSGELLRFIYDFWCGKISYLMEAAILYLVAKTYTKNVYVNIGSILIDLRKGKCIVLEIRNIYKQYQTGNFVQEALSDVSLSFRDSEFVSILGPSGSGKTTLLNIIGGLDKYDTGDIIINNVSTKNYKDRDWDSYRSHSIGFIFQSYNLIPHQTILKNVEMALTINGVPQKERKQRAIDALEKVGLKDHIHKKPNQLSGGQMQRVAIARALVNNPSIILADEPTGALDSKTSIQVMELLKEVAKDRLVIMVTHNPELAKEYSSRIVELKDGELVSDSNPYKVNKKKHAHVESKSFGKVGMSVLTSMRLSFSNLLSKIKRTSLVAFAGSIGIIGIALIMAISNGANAYIQSMEEQTLSEYPLTISKSTMDISSMMSVAGSIVGGANDDKIHEQQIISGLFGTRQENDLKALKEYIESGKTPIKDHVNAIEYGYGLVPYIYYINEKDNVRQVSPDNVISAAGLTSIASMMVGQTTTFNALPADESLYKNKYDVVEGRWPESPNELVVILGPGNTISDLALYNMGLKDTSKLDEMLNSFIEGSNDKKLDTGNPGSWEFKEVIGKEFHLVSPAHMYQYDEQAGYWMKIKEWSEIKNLAHQGDVLTIVGVARPNEENTTPTMTPAIYYTSDLVYEMIKTSKESEIVQAQLANMEINVFTGKRFDEESNDFDFSKIFNFDESAFEDMFKFDPGAFDIDLSGLGSLDLGDFDITDYIDASVIKDSMQGATDDVFEKLFEGVSVTIDQESLEAMYKELHDDFLKSTKNDPNMDFSNLGNAINEYLQTDNVKAVIENVISTHLEDSKDAILSSKVFVSQASQLITNYIEYTEINGLNPGDVANVEAYMKTDAAQIILTAMAMAAEDSIKSILTSSEFIDDVIEALNTDYNKWAVENDKPIASEIAQAFIEYMNSDSASKIIVKHVKSMLDMDTLEGNLEDISASISNSLSSAINKQMTNAVNALTAQLAVQIESVIKDAMTKYIEEMKGSFDFSSESLMELLEANMSLEKMKDVLTTMLSNSQQTAQSNLSAFGYADIDSPKSITLYPKDFETKANVIQILDEYNELMEQTDKDKVISYSDTVGSLMSSVTDIIDIISYVLVAFVSVSLIVSSIMIGVITYISVLERRKEIGILRAMGASKRNITQVFNCETIITGFLAGLIGVVMTWLILLPTNAILQYVTNQPNIHGYLPITTSGLLILLSITLTTIGGLLPSKSAAKQDPVIALRTE